MRVLLDGNDWSANYYLADQNYSEHGNNMLMDTIGSSGFYNAENKPLGAYKATIPGCDRSILLENGEIDDPFFGRNAERSRWSESSAWAFRKDFVIPPEMEDCAHIDLTFYSLGYCARVIVNETYMGVHTNMFVPWVIDISDAMYRNGAVNSIYIYFYPAPNADSAHYFYKPSEHAKYLFSQVNFGWDWARSLVPTGVFDHVELHGVRDARIADCYFKTTGTRVDLEIELAALTTHDETVKVELIPDDPAFATTVREQSVTVREAKRVFTNFEFEVPDARFWYPNLYGEQPLYTLRISVDGDVMEKQVSFRDLKMARNPGSYESAYPLTFVINGNPIFARGLNWVPADLILSRIDEKMYDREVRMAKEAGFNLLRVWGGGIIEKEAFYDACDRYGMLVWQEFPHSCSEYPAEGKYLYECNKIGEYAIRKMRNHPSTALFCGGNEMFSYGECPENPVYQQYEQLVRKLAPEYPYHYASPDLTRPGERPHGHWHFEEHKFWNSHFRLLASEYGCDGWAEEESLNRFIPVSDPPIIGQHWKYHFTLDSGVHATKIWRDILNPDMNSRYELSQASMFLQGEMLAYSMAHYRSNFPRSSGSFIWQFNESWPTNAYSIMDYYTMPKMAYYYIAKSNVPEFLFLEDDSFRIKDGMFRAKLIAVTDSGLESAVCETALYDIYGNQIMQKCFETDLAAGKTILDEFTQEIPADVPGGLIIAKLIIRKNGQIVYQNERYYGVPDYTSALHLEDGSAACEWNVENLKNGERKLNLTIRNTGKTALINVRASAEKTELYHIFWKENYVTVLPGEARTIFAILTKDAELPSGIRLKAWNFRKEDLF